MAYEKKHNQISKTDVKRQQISDLYVQGYNASEIARQMNLNPRTVRKYINEDEECSKMISEKFKTIQEQGKFKVEGAYLGAIDNLIALSEQDDDLNLKYKASVYIIEFINGKPAQQQKIDAKVENEVTTINVNIIDDENK